LGFGIGGPYDASKYDGISFWAKIDSGSYGLRVAFPDKDTLPDGGLCEGSAPENQCWDHYGYRITNLTTEWTKYTVSFSSLTQDGWGRSGGGFDPSTIFEVQFQIPKKQHVRSLDRRRRIRDWHQQLVRHRSSTPRRRGGAARRRWPQARAEPRPRPWDGLAAGSTR